ncbi:hypothetical protein K443DRAFT_3700 [Laccaria amethystina LaAM-08-1]|uniref:Uncharacterized protein n=1 Tax=Laccaria amethystina LaAM-08-1 TaxID=1095629 RepID=A0A0C9Y652_9AGAR|nr:hypothetical protein K443DRAFT_3700 [Laccaria amethystina LaAM-08-1]
MFHSLGTQHSSVSASSSSVFHLDECLIPILASVLSFGLSGHDLNIAVIFSSLPLFNVSSDFHFFYTLVVDARTHRSPLIFFPIALVSLTDAMVAVNCIGASLIAEELDEPYKSKNDVKLAVEVDSDFAWESVLSIMGKGAESKFAALAGKGGTAAAGGTEGSQGGTNLKRPTFHQPK